VQWIRPKPGIPAKKAPTVGAAIGRACRFVSLRLATDAEAAPPLLILGNASPRGRAAWEVVDPPFSVSPE